MPFNPPGIIGGGRLVSPAVNQDPFKGINDAITRARDRKLKEKALQLQAYQVWQDAESNYAGEGDFPGFQEWYKEYNSNESQASKGGFFGMLGDIAMAPIDKIGKIGKDLFTQGETSATKEIQAVVNQKNDANTNGADLDLSDSNSSDPIKKINQIKSENDGKVDKYLTEKANNLTTANDANLQDEGKPWFSFLTEMPERKYLNPEWMQEEEEEETSSTSTNPYSGHITTNQRGGKISGNRTGDKNKAYLEDGEYVLNRNAVDGMGKGFLDYINNERYPRFQAGGFNAPTIMGGGQIAQPRPPEEEEKEEGGGGMGDMAMKFLPMLFGAPPMQRGGYVPGYQSGQYISQKRANYLKEKRDREYQEGLLGEDLRRGVDVEEYNIGIEDWQAEQERGPKAWARTAADYLMPDFIESPFLSWKYGADIKNIADIPRGLAEKSKADYAEESIRHAYNLPEGGVSPTGYALHRKFKGTPEPSTVEGLSDEALKEKSKKIDRDSKGNFNAQEWLQTMYGDNWWTP